MAKYTGLYGNYWCILQAMFSSSSSLRVRHDVDQQEGNTAGQRALSHLVTKFNQRTCYSRVVRVVQIQIEIADFLDASAKLVGESGHEVRGVIRRLEGLSTQTDVT